MYTNNIIVSACGVLGYIFAGAIVRLLGAKRLLSEKTPLRIFYIFYKIFYILPLFIVFLAVYGLFISGILGITLYWSVSSLMTLIVAAAFITVACVSFSSLMGTVVALFPTQLR